MTTAITAPEQLSLQDTLTLSEVFVKSGYFKDARDQAQGVVKILAGREMGFGPVASMGGINLIQGKPSTGANLLAAAIKRAPQYNYRPVVMENERAELVFFENGEEVGRSVFTIEDAKKAGLVTKDNWKKYPRNMLFSRALSNGARWYCPDVYSGVTPYTPEELGADIDGDTGEIINVTPYKPVPTAVPIPEEIATGSEPDPVSPKDLLITVNDTTAGYYNHLKHLLGAIRIELGAEDWNWPDPYGREAWNEAYTVAVAHAEKESA